MNWDDTRYFLALARHTTLSAAARVLETSHTTVGRRIDALESTMGLKLFTRTPDGYLLTAAGEHARALAEDVEAAALALERGLTGASGALHGALVVTTVDVLVRPLGPTLHAFAQTYPEVDLTLLSDNRAADLHRREADVAIRVTNAPAEHLVGRKLCRFEYAVYGAPGRFAGVPLAELPWILWDPSCGAVLTERWWRGVAPGRRARLRVTVASALVEMMAQGFGVCVMPHRIAALYGFERLSDTIPELGADVWVLTHPDLKSSARVVAFFETLREHFEA